MATHKHCSVLIHKTEKEK